MRGKGGPRGPWRLMGRGGREVWGWRGRGGEGTWGTQAISSVSHGLITFGGTQQGVGWLVQGGRCAKGKEKWRGREGKGREGKG